MGECAHRTAGLGARKRTQTVSLNRERRRLINKRRNQIVIKAAACRRVAIERGLRHTAVLIDKLAEYASLSDKLPWPSQQTLALECGVTDRTIRYWLTALEELGVVQVYRSKPKRQTDGTWTRQTNRYLLCDRRATSTARSMPLRRRQTRRTAGFSPTGNQLPVTVTEFEPGGPSEASGPPTPQVVQSVGTATSADDHRTDTKHTADEKRANREGLREVRKRLVTLR